MEKRGKTHDKNINKRRIFSQLVLQMFQPIWPNTKRPFYQGKDAGRETRTVAALLWRSDALITRQVYTHNKTKGRELEVY
jgi:hypothetical protein